MSRFGDIAIGILVGATGLAGLSYLCSDDFKGFGNSDDDDDAVSIGSTINKDNEEKLEPVPPPCDEVDSQEEEDVEVESDLVKNLETE